MVTARAAAIARGLSIVFVGSVLAQGSIEPTGPLVGAVTADSARILVHAAEGAKVEVRYGLADAEPAARVAFEPIDKPDAAIPGRAALATLTGLKAATAYRFAVSVDGKTSPELAGSFRTAPAGPARFRVGVTSCMKIGQPQASWRLFLSQQPDLHLTLGDTHYADTTDPGVQWQHHLRYRREPDFARVLRHVPTYAMWDDHDYGPNDSDGTARGKERSLISWNRVWANPPAGADGRPGAFFRFGWGEVDFFMVDGRYHRSPNKAPDDDKKRMLGDAQFAWLIAGLKASRAKFKVIASGSTLQHSEGDGWRIYTFARRRLFDALREHKISGVLYFSGDIHQSLVWEHPESERVGYPLVEVISSGVAGSKTLSFATVDFDTAAADPTVRVRVVSGDGLVRQDKSWRLSTLSAE